MNVQVYFNKHLWFIHISIKKGSLEHGIHSYDVVQFYCVKPTRKQIRKFIKHIKKEYINA